MVLAGNRKCLLNFDRHAHKYACAIVILHCRLGAWQKIFVVSAYSVSEVEISGAIHPGDVASCEARRERFAP